MGLECGGCLPSSEPALICQHPVFLRGHSSVRNAGSHLKLQEFGGAGAWVLIWAQTSDNWILSPVIIAVAGAGTLDESLLRASVSPSVQTRL